MKAQVGLEALKGIEPVHVIAARHKIHPVQVSQWKKEVAGRLPELFTRKAEGELEATKAREKELFEEIGRLKRDLEWLKKKVVSVKFCKSGSEVGRFGEVKKILGWGAGEGA